MDHHVSYNLVYANIHQPFNWSCVPIEIIPPHLVNPVNNLNIRQQTKFQTRRLAFFLLYQLYLKHKLPIDELKSFTKLTNGRPILSNSTIDFNISHSGDWLAILISIPNIISTTERILVGIDIETYNGRQRDYYAIMQKYAAIQEFTWLQQHKYPVDVFYQSWCLREAVLKTKGIGLVDLHKVIHNPYQQKITYAEIATGTLFFSQQLPFYLAFFVPETTQQALTKLQITQYYAEQRFKAVRLTDYIAYRVN